jgi:hypothetical protein
MNQGSVKLRTPVLPAVSAIGALRKNCLGEVF